MQICVWSVITGVFASAVRVTARRETSQGTLENPCSVAQSPLPSSTGTGNRNRFIGRPRLIEPLDPSLPLFILCAENAALRDALLLKIYPH